MKKLFTIVITITFLFTGFVKAQLTALPNGGNKER